VTSEQLVLFSCTAAKRIDICFLWGSPFLDGALAHHLFFFFLEGGGRIQPQNSIWEGNIGVKPPNPPEEVPPHPEDLMDVLTVGEPPDQ